MENNRTKKIFENYKKAKELEFYKYIPDNINSIKDYNRIPILKKEYIRKVNPFELFRFGEEQMFEYHESFGTTGIPVSTWLTKQDFDNYVSQILESDVKFNSKDIVVVRFPYAISVPAHIFTKAIQTKNGCVVPVSRGSMATPQIRVVKILKKLKATILTCIPTEAFIIFNVARKMGIDIKKDLCNLRALCVAGELLTNKRKENLESLWGVPVFNFFGTTETGNIATSCKYGQLHGSEEHFYFEVVDIKTGEPVEDGRIGILLITTLTKQGFPLIRYNLNDLVSIERSKCKCGKQGIIIEHHGRIQDAVITKNKIITLKMVQEEVLNKIEETLYDNWRIYFDGENYIVEIESHKNNKEFILEDNNIGLKIIVKYVKENTIIDYKEIINRPNFSKPKKFYKIYKGDDINESKGIMV